jgi:hypothetical protein
VFVQKFNPKYITNTIGILQLLKNTDSAPPNAINKENKMVILAAAGN